MFDKEGHKVLAKASRGRITPSLFKIGHLIIDMLDINFIELDEDERAITFGFKNGAEHILHFDSGLSYKVARNKIDTILRKFS